MIILAKIFIFGQIFGVFQGSFVGFYNRWKQPNSKNCFFSLGRKQNACRLRFISLNTYQNDKYRCNFFFRLKVVLFFGYQKKEDRCSPEFIVGSFLKKKKSKKTQHKILPLNMFRTVYADVHWYHLMWWFIYSIFTVYNSSSSIYDITPKFTKLAFTISIHYFLNKKKIFTKFPFCLTIFLSNILSHPQNYVLPFWGTQSNFSST